MSDADDALLKLTRATARTAAEYVRARRPDGRVEVAATKSSGTDVVTAIDRATEDLIRATIGAARPHDAIMGEENGQSGGSSDVTWIVDPIDGTVNFVHGLPAYSVSIAAAVDDTVRTGCVVNVVTGEEFAAARGHGATASADGTETTLGPPGRTTLEHALVGTGFSYTASIRARQGQAVARMLESVADIRRIGSAALDLCNVACGRLDAYVEEGLLPWDLAAGRLIAQESGIVVSGLDGPPGQRRGRSAWSGRSEGRGPAASERRGESEERAGRQARPATQQASNESEGWTAERVTVACVPSVADDFLALVRHCGF